MGVDRCMHPGGGSVSPAPPFDLQAAADDIVIRHWYTNHGPVLLGLEAALAQSHPCAGAVGLCNQAAGLFVWAATFDMSTGLYAHSDLATVAEAGHFACAGRAATVHDAGWHLVPLRHPTLPSGRRLAVATVVDVHAHDFSEHVMRAEATFVQTGSSPQSAMLGAPGGVVFVRDEAVLNMLRTARYHHNGEHIVDVPVRFNLKMSEIQAVAAVAELLPPAEALALIHRLSPRG